MAVAAPKDPEQQRAFFYIMRQKEIYVSKQDDGRGIQFLYQSDGRLESSANVVGGVEDEEMLKLLGTVDGFKTLVHSIGVSVELDNPYDEVTFVFQMYGKEDLYGGGANIMATMKGDGSETRVYLSDVEWTQDDDIPGQIKIIMDEPDKSGSLSVRLYLNEGFTAPEQEDDLIVDMGSASYKNMIGKSLVSTGNTQRLARCISRAKAGEDVTIAFIGGSITQGAGATPINTECYAYKAFCSFMDRFGKGDNVHYVKAGVGGTPSELGMLRFDRDVLRDGTVSPDVVVVEFAVNDEGDETKGNCYESLVRKILKLENEPAVILLFSVFADDYNLEDRLIPVGERYDLPMVSVKRAVTPQFYDKENRVLTKNQYFYDCYHPTNLGHTIMADCLMNLIETVAEENGESERLIGVTGNSEFSLYNPDFDAPPAIGASFDDVVLIDKKELEAKKQLFSGLIIEEGGFVFTDTVLQSVEMDLNLELTPEFPYNWMYDGTKRESVDRGSVFSMKLNCKRLVLIFKDSGEVDAAKADVYVDGRFVRVADPYINRWLHCNPIIIIDGDESAEHLVEVKVQEPDVEKKFTILGFGIVQ